MCVTKTNSVPGRQLEPEQEHPPCCILTPYAYSLVGNIRLIYKISYTCPFKKWVFLSQEESLSFSYIVIFYIWHLTQIIKIEYSSTLLRELSDNGKDKVSLDLCLVHRRHSILLCWLEWITQKGQKVHLHVYDGFQLECKDATANKVLELIFIISAKI